MRLRAQTLTLMRDKLHQENLRLIKGFGTPINASS